MVKPIRKFQASNNFTMSEIQYESCSQKVLAYNATISIFVHPKNSKLKGDFNLQSLGFEDQWSCTMYRELWTVNAIPELILLCVLAN